MGVDTESAQGKQLRHQGDERVSLYVNTNVPALDAVNQLARTQASLSNSM
jgi:hypothetical protein